MTVAAKPSWITATLATNALCPHLLVNGGLNSRASEGQAKVRQRTNFDNGAPSMRLDTPRPARVSGARC
jgi:hypothetical protein